MISHFVLIAAAWGYAASWLNEFVKQDGWPKPVNTVIADGVVVVSAAVAVFAQGDIFTLHAFWTALVAAFLAACVNHQLFLAPTGIGPALQSATSIVKSGVYDPLRPISPAPAPMPPPVVPAPGLAPVKVSAAKKAPTKRTTRKS